MSIDQLLPLCKAKDERAQLEVYQRYHLAIYHSALRIVRNPVDTEDLMHEGFLTAFEKLEQYKGENKFGGWLKQIDLRKAFNLFKQKEKTAHYNINEAVLAETTVEKTEENKAQIVQSNHIKTSLSGSGKIVLTIATQNLSSQLSGSGKIQLKGKAQAVAAKLSGSGSIRLQEVKAKDAEATLAGSGSIYLSCSNDLDATVAGSGRIRYFGEPAGKIHTKVAGSGSIRLATE